MSDNINKNLTPSKLLNIIIRIDPLEGKSNYLIETNKIYTNINPDTPALELGELLLDVFFAKKFHLLEQIEKDKLLQLTEVIYINNYKK